MHQLKIVLLTFILALGIGLPSLALAGRCDVFKKFARSHFDDDLAEEVGRVCKKRCSVDDAEEIFRRRSGKGEGKFKGRDAHARENEAVISIVNDLKLSKKQRRLLHDEITHQGLSRQEIMERARDMFNK